MWIFTKKLIALFSSAEFIRFFVVGFTAFLLDLSVLSLEIYVLKFDPFIGIISVANVISVSTAIVYGYVLQRAWTFKKKEERMVTQGGKYAGVAIFNMGMNNVFYGLLLLTGLIPPVAKFMVTVAQMVWSFFLYKYVVFRK